MSNSPAPALMICERTGRWAVAWRRAIGPAVRVQEFRSIDQLDEALTGDTVTVVAMDVTEFAVEKVVAAIDRWASRGFTVIALASPAFEDEILSLREAGAAHVVLSPRQLAPVARIVARRLASSTSPDASSIPPRIGQVVVKLPWERYAKTSR